MPTFDIHLTHEVSTTVTVEAETVEEALDKVYDSDDMPGSLTYGAFGQASVDDSGEWEPVSAYRDGELVWEDRESDQ